MKTNIQIGGLLFSAVLMFGCASSNDDMLVDQATVERLTTSSEQQKDIRDYSRFSAVRHNKSLNDYAQQLVMQLNTQQPISRPVAVASFVDFDQSLRKTNSLGNQLSEAVLVELGQMGYRTAEVNIDDKIEVNHQGNFVFSRQHEEISNDYCCVLSGNLIYERSGVRVNAKLIDLESRRILGASTLSIPYFVIDHLGYAQSR